MPTVTLVGQPWTEAGRCCLQLRVPQPDGTARTVGDVDFGPVRERLGPAGWITPVPGGVGPVTVAMLLRNTLRSAELLLGS